MRNWTTTAFVFPGQGSQQVGMGADLAAAYPVARATFEEADEILGLALSRLCFEGPGVDLDDTINTQPALYVMGAALLRVLEAELGAVRPAMVAGHSLGELTALHAAGALGFAAGLRLVRERGRLMQQAGAQQPGAMAAVLGLDAATVRRMCAEIAAESGQVLVLANDNCEGQLVISGERAAIDVAVPLALALGAKRAIPLAVSVASHSPLMSAISDEFRAALDATEFTSPDIPVIGNVQARPLADVPSIRAELTAQLTSTVRWTESIQYMAQAGIQSYVELGPRDVLSGLIKRIDRAAERVALNDTGSLGTFISAASER